MYKDFDNYHRKRGYGEGNPLWDRYWEVTEPLHRHLTSIILYSMVEEGLRRGFRYLILGRYSVDIAVEEYVIHREYPSVPMMAFHVSGNDHHYFLTNDEDVAVLSRLEDFPVVDLRPLQGVAEYAVPCLPSFCHDE